MVNEQGTFGGDGHEGDEWGAHHGKWGEEWDQGLPPKRARGGACRFELRRRGSCRYGENCKFSHDPNQLAEEKREQGDRLTVLMVTEKPGIARTLASSLGGHGKHDRRNGLAQRCPVYEFTGMFQGEQANFLVISVHGPVYSLDYGEGNNLNKYDPKSLFTAKLEKAANREMKIPEHLEAEASGCHVLVLWLDCDREGENICFEVIQNVLPAMETTRTFRGAFRERVFRARFSSMCPTEVQRAMACLTVPNEEESESVEARMEIDFRLSMAFSRFQTKYFRTNSCQHLCDLMKHLTYGPCKMPMRWLCVHRHCQVQDLSPNMWSARRVHWVRFAS